MTYPGTHVGTRIVASIEPSTGPLNETAFKLLGPLYDLLSPCRAPSSSRFALRSVRGGACKDIVTCKACFYAKTLGSGLISQRAFDTISERLKRPGFLGFTIY